MYFASCDPYQLGLKLLGIRAVVRIWCGLLGATCRSSCRGNGLSFASGAALQLSGMWAVVCVWGGPLGQAVGDMGYRLHWEEQQEQEEKQEEQQEEQQDEQREEPEDEGERSGKTKKSKKPTLNTGEQYAP